MGKFKYRFEPILNVKEKLKAKIQQEISLIDKEINDYENKKRFYMEERESVRQKMIENNLRVSEYQSAKMFDTQLGEMINAVERKIDQLRLNKAEKQKELLEKKKEVKVFETLKEKARNDYMDEERKKEMKELNEIAIRIYNGGQN